MNDASLPSDLAVVNNELGRKGFTPDVYFDSGKDDLSDDVRDKLARNADLLKVQSQFNITIEGHADSRGTDEDNFAPGERRAAAVKDYLYALGVAAHRIRVISYGAERPVCTEEAEDCWVQNRRAHMLVTGRG
jgi:peptidoglycan-associated lipoprotein